MIILDRSGRDLVRRRPPLFQLGRPALPRLGPIAAPPAVGASGRELADQPASECVGGCRG
jgi:hypothetical protein